MNLRGNQAFSADVAKIWTPDVPGRQEVAGFVKVAIN
jgi:hypothetical protein